MRWFRKSKKNDLVCSVVSCEANDYRPYLLRREAVLGALALIVFVEVIVLAHSFFSFKSEHYVASVLPGVVAVLSNEARAEEGLSALSYDATLAEAASLKARDMAEKEYFAHTSPEGIAPWHWLQRVGYEYSYAGENLAIRFSDSDKLVQAWLSSPTHRANILKENFTHIGVGMATGTYQGRETLFVVQFFATQKGSVGTPVPTSQQASGTPDSEGVAPILADTPASPDSPQILGTDGTGVPLSGTIAHASASPFTTATYIIAGILFFFLSVIGIAYLVSPKAPRLPASAGGLAVVACALLVLMWNTQVLGGGNVLLPDGEAAVFQALEGSR